ncbi:WD40 repeat-like protein [Lentithecium fluviatile CBS 122367]|uniref:WD40 repeat-like protein n=1 Tax=Lentithecium fluviatile CBS 122367 TaxID=1168545 RepID=A0A6G1IIW4_9PLEO|nr:WD40 repeat-like protein [Lentithecium fluviatile CBS 122367]
MIKQTQDAPSNFLWLNMALDIVTASPTPWNAPDIMEELKTKAPDIDTMYSERRKNMAKFREKDRDYCTRALSAVATAYRPLLDRELEAILNLPPEVDLTTLIEGILSPFLKLYKDKGSKSRRVYFVHLSAKDFIRRGLNAPGMRVEHSIMTIRCLDIMRETFQGASSALPVDYAAIFWIKHLSELNGDDEGGAISKAINFLRKDSVRWLEVLDSWNLLSEALAMIAKLDLAPTEQARKSSDIDTQKLRQTVQDVSRFLKVHWLWKSTSTWEEGSQTEDDKNSRINPSNSLLFYPSRTALRQEQLKEHFKWLAAAPIINLSDTASRESLHAMRHPDWVRGCTFSLDGRMVASASDDRRVRLWDVETGKLQHVLEGFTGYVYSVAISKSGPNGHALLAAFESKAIRVWELYTGRMVTILKDGVDTEDVAERTDKADNEGDKSEGESDEIVQNFDVAGISITQDGARLAAATRKQVIVWETDSFKATVWEDEEGSDKFLQRVVFSQEGRLLASSAGSQITVWDAITGKVARRLPKCRPRPPDEALEDSQDELDEEEQDKAAGHSGAIDGLAFSPGAKFLASGSDDHTARIWDVETGTTLAVLRYHGSHVNSVSFSADGIYLATGSTDETIGIWKQQTSGDWSCGPGHTKEVRCVAISEGGETIASASSDGVICLWDGVTGIRQRTMDQGHNRSVTALVFSQDGTRLVSASSDNHACVWEVGVKKKGLMHRLEGHEDWIRAVAVSPNMSLVATGSDDKTVRVWDISAAEAKEAGKEDEAERSVPCRVFKGHTDWVYSVAFSPDGLHLASAGDDRHVMIWDLEGQGDKATPDKNLGNNAMSDLIRGLVFSTDGGSVLTVGTSMVVMVWNPNVPEQEPCLLQVENRSDFKSMQIRKDHPNVLLNESGAWPFELDVAAMGNAAAGTLQCPRRDVPPPWSPVSVIDDGRWITWDNDKVIFLPTEFQPASSSSYQVQGHSVVIGTESGQVLLFRLEREHRARTSSPA